MKLIIYVCIICIFSSLVDGQCPFMSGKGAQISEMTIGELYDHSTEMFKGLMTHVPQWMKEVPDDEILTQALEGLKSTRDMLETNRHRVLAHRRVQALVLTRLLYGMQARAAGKLDQALALMERCSSEAISIQALPTNEKHFDDLYLHETIAPFCVESMTQIREEIESTKLKSEL